MSSIRDHIDVFTSSLIMVDDDGNEDELIIHDPWSCMQELLSLKEGDTLNIKNLGLIEVIDITEYEEPDPMMNIFDLVLTCEVIADYIDFEAMELENKKKERWYEISKKEFLSSWGVENIEKFEKDFKSKYTG